MILFVEPICKNIDVYVPAYPLPAIEIASYAKSNLPQVEIQIISMPVDYGLPLTEAGKKWIYQQFLSELAELRPKGIGISCTAIAQAEEMLLLCELIKEFNPDTFIFVGGYFPTVYYEEIFARSSAVDLVVIGEGEVPTLKIVELLEEGKDPRDVSIPNLAWSRDGHVETSGAVMRFDPGEKALIRLDLLRHRKAYDILPYAFSRGCPYMCNFCMEQLIRPVRKEVPESIVIEDLANLSRESDARTLLVSDALFKSFDLFPFLRSLGMKINFETRCDVIDPSIIRKIADVCGVLALGFESASYETLKRMNKIRDRNHYEHYISNTTELFHAAVNNALPIIVFFIAGYPGDTKKDLEISLEFARKLSKNKGPGGHVFKVGECRAYPKTRTYDLAGSLPGVVFDDDGVFGQNIVREPSQGVHFDTVLTFMKQIFAFSHPTDKLNQIMVNMMPFFRLPALALRDETIPGICFADNEKNIFNVQREGLQAFRKKVPALTKKYKEWMSLERSTRNLPI